MTGLIPGIEDFVHYIHMPTGMSNIKQNSLPGLWSWSWSQKEF
jgi:hypothetical protein